MEEHQEENMKEELLLGAALCSLWADMLPPLLLTSDTGGQRWGAPRGAAGEHLGVLWGCGCGAPRGAVGGTAAVRSAAPLDGETE